MAGDRKWMYDGWNLKQGHSEEWRVKSNQFIAHAFSLLNNGLARCPCKKCRSCLSHDKKKVSLHICKNGYTPGYEVWVHHGEEVQQNQPVEEDHVTDEDMMDEILDAICPEFEEDSEDPPTPEVARAHNSVCTFFCDTSDGH